MISIEMALKKILNDISAASTMRKVNLIAVSKTKPIEAIQEAYKCGQKKFGENYVDEFVEKAPQLPADIEWHFIGHLQTNKCSKLLKIPNLNIIESVDSFKLAGKINKVCSAIPRTIKVLIEVNISGEKTKTGATYEDAYKLAGDIIKELKCLQFSGLMGMGEISDIEGYRKLYKLREAIAKEYKLPVETLELSMGTSIDMIEAIKEGSTEVRIGTSIFGERTYPKK